MDLTAVAVAPEATVISGPVGRHPAMVVAAIAALTGAVVELVIRPPAPAKTARVGTVAKAVTMVAIPAGQMDIGGLLAPPAPAFRAAEASPFLAGLTGAEVPRRGLDIAATVAPARQVIAAEEAEAVDAAAFVRGVVVAVGARVAKTVLQIARPVTATTAYEATPMSLISATRTPS